METLLSKLGTFLRQHWQPKPIDPPQVDPELKKLDDLRRSAEVIRYSILSLEFWLSPLGRLREWVRLNGKVSAVLLVPALLVLPLITFIVRQVAQWLGLLLSISGKLIVLPLVVLIAAGVIMFTLVLFRAILGR